MKNKCDCLCHVLPSTKPYECICCTTCPKCKQRIAKDKIEEHAKECIKWNIIRRKFLINKMKNDIERLIWLKDLPTIDKLPPIKSAIVTKGTY